MNRERDRPAICERPKAHSRCPYCHDEVFSGGVRCGCCGAKHHSMCVDEYAACATCGYDLQDEVHRVLLSESEAHDSAVWRAVQAVIPDERSWHVTWESWGRSLTHPLFVGAALAAGGLTLLVYVIWRVVT